MTAPIAVITDDQIAAGLRDVGISAGDVVVVHSSLSQTGYLVGGPAALGIGLRSCLEAEGTVVVPTFTPHLSHPSTWLPDDRSAEDRLIAAAAMPPFDARTTPSARRMGAFAEYTRNSSSALRSAHPHTSFTADGPKALRIVQQHGLDYRLSGGGPLGSLWNLDAKVVLIGVGWDRCTAFHLAEYESAYPGRRVGEYLVPMGRGTWRAATELMVWEGDFERLGDEYEQTPGAVATTQIGHAFVRSFRLRDAVRFAHKWLPENRDLSSYVDPPGWIDARDAPTFLPVSTVLS